jgi:hypothetical protein
MRLFPLNAKFGAKTHSYFVQEEEMNPTRSISLTQAATAAVCLSLLVFSPVTTHAAPDAAQVAGDLQVGGIHFSSDGSVQTKASPWGYGAPNGVDIGYMQGKVGIGTLTPSTELDVVGTVKATQLLGGANSTASGSYSTVSGGNTNTASGPRSTVSGGESNTASADYSTVSGGFSNTASGLLSAVGGGYFNIASVGNSVVSGGSQNRAIGGYSVVSGGYFNVASGGGSVVSGGQGNTASGNDSVVSGGYTNEAGGDLSWAGGTRATIRNATAAGNTTGDQGTFLWSDANNFNFNSTKSNEFAVRATGGFRFVTAIDGSGIPIQTTVIDSNGYVGIGNTAPISPLTVTSGNVTSGALWAGTANVNGFEVGGTGTDRYVSMKRDGAANSVLHITKSDAGKLVTFFINGTEKGTITYDTDKQQTLYNSTSDARLKENIRPTAFGVEDLMKLEVKDYNFKADTNGTVLTGFLAQDLYRVIPQAVSVGGDDPTTNPWQVDYGKLTPFLVKAVQELKTRNDGLQAENDAIKANYDAMKTDYNAMKERMERVEKLLAAMKP